MESSFICEINSEYKSFVSAPASTCGEDVSLYVVEKIGKNLITFADQTVRTRDENFSQITQCALVCFRSGESPPIDAVVLILTGVSVHSCSN